MNSKTLYDHFGKDVNINDISDPKKELFEYKAKSLDNKRVKNNGKNKIEPQKYS